MLGSNDMDVMCEHLYYIIYNLKSLRVLIYAVQMY